MWQLISRGESIYPLTLSIYIYGLLWGLPVVLLVQVPLKYQINLNRNSIMHMPKINRDMAIVAQPLSADRLVEHQHVNVVEPLLMS